jgi:hypothetical protein
VIVERILTAGVVGVALLDLQSRGVPNSEPSVNLSASDYPACSDQHVIFTASGEDPDGDYLIYSWEVDGVVQLTHQSSTVYYWLNETTIYPKIKVTASDGYGGTATDSVTITVNVAASLRVLNQSGYSIYNLLMGEHRYGFSTDALGLYILPDDYIFVAYGVLGGRCYDFQARSSSLSAKVWCALAGSLMANGYYRIFGFHPTYWTLSDMANAKTISRDLIQSPSETSPLPLSEPGKQNSFAGAQVRKLSPTVDSDLSSHIPGQPFEVGQ